MRLRQKFTEKDLEELGKVFSVTMKLGDNTKKGIKWSNILLLFVIIFLLVAAAGVYILEGTVVNKMGIAAGAAILFILIYFLLELWKCRVDHYPLRMVKNKYRTPFRISLENDVLIYKGEGFAVRDIDAVAEYKHFLFLYAGRKWMIMKVQREDKKYIMDTLRSHVEIRFYKMDRPFNMKDLQ